MKTSKLVDACVTNSVKALRHLTLTSGGEVWEPPGMIFAAGAHGYAGTFHNAAARIDHHTDPRLVLANATDFFSKRNRNYVLWSTEEFDADLEVAARTAGMPLRQPMEGVPGMARTTPLAEAALPMSVELVSVRESAEVRTFAAVVGEAFATRAEPGRESKAGDGPNIAQPPEAAALMFGNPQTILDPQVFAVIAYVDGVPAASAMHFLSDGVVGLYWVSTVGWARRRGLADIVTRSVVNEGFRRGASIAVLQASAMGAPLYDKMSFSRVSVHRRYFGMCALPNDRKHDIGLHSSAVFGGHR